MVTMAEKFKTFQEDCETKFLFEGKPFSIIEHSDHPLSNILACNDRGRFLFHEAAGNIEFYAVQEIFGARSEPHITF